MDAQLRLAVSRSHLRDLPGGVVDELLVGAGRVRIAAGSVTHREGEDAPHLELVIAGVVRVFVTAPDGRTMTIRYCRPGALIGAVSLFATGVRAAGHDPGAGRRGAAEAVANRGPSRRGA